MTDDGRLALTTQKDAIISSMAKEIVYRDVMRRLRAAVRDAGSAAAYARLAGVSTTFVCLVLDRKKKASAKVLRPLGLRMKASRSVVYWEVE